MAHPTRGWNEAATPGLYIGWLLVAARAGTDESVSVPTRLRPGFSWKIA